MLFNELRVSLETMATSIHVTQRRKLPLTPLQTPNQVTLDFINSCMPHGNSTDYKRNGYLNKIQYGDCLKKDKDLEKH